MAEIVMSSTPDSATLLQLLAQRDAEIRAEDLLIEKLKLQLANLRRHRFGSKSEVLDHIIGQLELMLEDIEASTAEAPEAANIVSPTESAKAQPKRRPLPDHLPREEIILIERELAPARDNLDIWYWVEPKLKSEGFDYEGLSMVTFVSSIKIVIDDEILPTLKNAQPEHNRGS